MKKGRIECSMRTGAPLFEGMSTGCLSVVALRARMYRESMTWLAEWTWVFDGRLAELHSRRSAELTRAEAGRFPTRYGRSRPIRAEGRVVYCLWAANQSQNGAMAPSKRPSSKSD